SLKNRNEKAEESNSYNAVKTSSANQKTLIFQDYGTDNVNLVVQSPLCKDFKTRKKDKEKAKPQLDDITQHEALAKIFKKLTKIEKDYELIFLLRALAPNRS
ncbi:10385_t:CDS:1, partial [Dentiscutata heterogama]